MQKKPWFKNPLLIVIGLSLLLVILSAWISFLEPFAIAFSQYLKIVFWPIALGFVLGGMMDYFIPSSYISKHLSRNKKRTIVYSVGLGFLMSACNHGILAISMELYKKGASAPAVISFLLASPWANLPVTLLLLSFFKLNALVIILTAILIAMATGFIFQLLLKFNLIEKNAHTHEVSDNFSVREDLKSRFQRFKEEPKDYSKMAHGIWQGAVKLGDMVLLWIMIGILLAAFAHAYIPHSFFQDYLGPHFLGLLMTLGVATIIEVCSEGTAPLAFEIYHQTGALGNAFVFLMAGVVTDITEIGLVWKNLGKKVALWMMGITIPFVLIFGFLFNQMR